MEASEARISPVRPARIHSLTFFRALTGALLTLALLSGAIPFTVLFASHACSMPCCAEGGCETGACDGALLTSTVKSTQKSMPEEEELCGAQVTGKARGGSAATTHEKISKAEASHESGHCDGDEKDRVAEQKPKGAARAPVASENKRTGSFSAAALAAPCSKDCCAVASSFTNFRRGRDYAPVYIYGGLPPPSLLSLSLYSLTLQPVASAHLEGLGARAPPSLASSNPA